MLARTHTFAVASALAGLALGAWAVAGPLAPPPGPVTPTGANFVGGGGAIALPIVIDTPGLHKLNGNITGAENLPGIIITASNVTLDLCGYSVRGVARSLDGVQVTSAAANVVIKNGFITNWGQSGVDAFESPGGVRLESLNITNNGDTGAILSLGGFAQDTLFVSNGGHGLKTGETSVVKCCTALENTLNGFDAAQGSLFESCTAQGNNVDGFHVSADALVRGCVSTENANGVVAGARTTVTHCQISVNTAIGVKGQRLLVRGNSVFNNAVMDFDVDLFSTIIENHT